MTRIYFLDFEEGKVRSKIDGWSIPLVRKNDHAYLEWPVETFFTKAELRKVNRHFYHLSSERIYAVMKQSNPAEVSSKVLLEFKLYRLLVTYYSATQMDLIDFACLCRMAIMSSIELYVFT